MRHNTARHDWNLRLSQKQRSDEVPQPGGGSSGAHQRGPRCPHRQTGTPDILRSDHFAQLSDENVKLAAQNRELSDQYAQLSDENVNLTFAIKYMNHQTQSENSKTGAVQEVLQTQVNKAWIEIGSPRPRNASYSSNVIDDAVSWSLVTGGRSEEVDNTVPE
eukprot:GHVO01016623.1.p1 GENE.GHVO01016623.1~~GHVO01016623.1.p1  ORF type:complete len:162 (+),score=12.34 GHVO01016623.1:36-521(+)